MFQKTVFKAPSGPGPNFGKPCQIFFDALPFKKIGFLGSSLSKFWPFLKNNSFQDPIRPLVQSWENPDPRVKYFLVLYLLKKFPGL